MNVTRHRARLVAKGYIQRHGIDYTEVFSPVAKYNTVRFFFALAAQEELEIIQLDFKNAFLNGRLDEEIYLEQPEGCINTEHPDFVYRLYRALYGLKQASSAW